MKKLIIILSLAVFILMAKNSFSDTYEVIDPNQPGTATRVKIVMDQKIESIVSIDSLNAEIERHQKTIEGILSQKETLEKQIKILKTKILIIEKLQ